LEFFWRYQNGRGLPHFKNRFAFAEGRFMLRRMVSMIPVPLGARAYDVVIGAGVLAQLGERAAALGLGRRCAVVTDSNVGEIYGDAVMAGLRKGGFEPVLVTVPAGEASKALGVVEKVCEEMIAAGLDRQAWVLALGGGVMGDLAGFVASVYYRGIPFVQAPTSVIAQVDSAVGGKTGVNAGSGKNLIGAFYQPRLVLADVGTLSTLPEREFNEGVAEMIKHAAIADGSLLDLLTPELLKNPETLTRVIRRNVEIKAKVVCQDEFETKGLRALLNFGHTIGHAIESTAGYGRFLHGEALSLGLIAASRLSVAKAGLAAADFERIFGALKRFKLPLRLPAELTTPALMETLRKDKKFAVGEVRFVLCRRLGEAFVSKDVSMEEISSVIEALR